LAAESESKLRGAKQEGGSLRYQRAAVKKRRFLERLSVELVFVAMSGQEVDPGTGDGEAEGQVDLRQVHVDPFLLAGDVPLDGTLLGVRAYGGRVADEIESASASTSTLSVENVKDFIDKGAGVLAFFVTIVQYVMKASVTTSGDAIPWPTWMVIASSWVTGFSPRSRSTFLRFRRWIHVQI
jgi:hypothetical protein